MKIIISAKKMELTDDLKQYAEKKFGKLEKFFKEDAQAKITMEIKKERNKVEATIYSQNIIFRAEEAEAKMTAAIDRAVETIEGQIRKNKTRLAKRLRDASLESFAPIVEKESEAEAEIKIVKTKTFDTKPMSAEEAVLQMNLLGHNFFVFENSSDSKTSIVYKRTDNDYGLIEIN